MYPLFDASIRVGIEFCLTMSEDLPELFHEEMRIVLNVHMLLIE
jgi:hypothetical protein